MLNSDDKLVAHFRDLKSGEGGGRGDGNKGFFEVTPAPQGGESTTAQPKPSPVEANFIQPSYPSLSSGLQYLSEYLLAPSHRQPLSSSLTCPQPLQLLPAMLGETQGGT